MKRAIFKILDTPSELKRKIEKEIVSQLQARMSIKRAVLKRRAESIVENKIRSSETVNSLLVGSLREDFGLYEGLALNSVEKIISVLKQSLDVIITKGSTGFILTVQIYVDDITYMRELTGVSYISNGRHEVTWLDWLLTKGTTVVVDTHEKKTFSRPIDNSRAGHTIMVATGSKSFRVDPKFAGTRDSNFITRVIEESYDDFMLLLKDFLEDKL